MKMQKLAAIFHPENRKVLIIGIGNHLRSDDGVGPKIIEQLRASAKVALLNAETNIERYIEPIRNSGASTLLFIDSMSLGQKPGHYELVSIDAIRDFSFNSHNISLKRLKDFFHMPAFVLGIEPETLKVGEKLSPGVQMAADKITKALNTLIDDFQTG